MGMLVDRETFRPEEYGRFSARLEASLAALEEVLARPGFGQGPATVGAELEMHLVDPAMRPLRRNCTVLRRAHDPRMVPELDAFNLEANTRPGPLAGRPFSALAEELRSAVAIAGAAAAESGGRIVLVGTLPTLLEGDLGPDALTALPRYRALARSLRAHRAAPFRLRIHGEDALELEEDDVSPLGASTSFQLHLKVPPADFGRFWNAAQAATAPALALAGNAPLFLGRRLWQETRIALFRQATDDRTHDEEANPARVSFGRDWVRGGALELFAESVRFHRPVLPVCGEEEPLAVARAGGVPRLDELRLHQGTVWTWNRAVYDPADGGHLRIEFRALPAGPTPVDMLASAAFLLGLTLALAPSIEERVRTHPFALARHDFYAAAREGLEARLHWNGAAPAPAPAVLEELLPPAEEALAGAGVERDELPPLFAVLRERLRTGQTGARWQLATLARHEARAPRAEALCTMLGRYAALAQTGAPVHAWPVG